MATLQIRIDEKTKTKAKKIFSEMGIDMSRAITLFFQQTITEQGLPFRPMTKNGLTRLQEMELDARLSDSDSLRVSQEEMMRKFE